MTWHGSIKEIPYHLVSMFVGTAELTPGEPKRGMHIAPG